MIRAFICGVILAVVVAAGVFAYSPDTYRYRDILPLAKDYEDDVGNGIWADARRIAESRWPVRCDGEIELHLEQFPNRATVAAAEWKQDSSGRIFDCFVAFNMVRLPLPFDRLCAAMMHEYGHLAGRKHVRNPRSVMYWRITNLNIPSACRAEK